MTITVKYFASLSEEFGRREERIDANRITTVADVWALVSRNRTLPANLLFAVNLDYARPDTQVRDGDEVAFFPPITGG
jgi:molybdopterin synthase sulfur carrier subunit